MDPSLPVDADAAPHRCWSDARGSARFAVDAGREVDPQRAQRPRREGKHPAQASDDLPVQWIAGQFGDDADNGDYLHAGEGPKADASQLQDRKRTRLNSSHVKISYAVFC